MLTSVYKIIQGSEDRYGPKDQTTPLHSLQSDLAVRWEERDHEHEQEVRERDDIERDAQSSQPPARRWQVPFSQALDEDAADGDEVRAYECGDA